jgi:hypothetical protein
LVNCHDWRMGRDLRLRIPATTYLEQVHHNRGEHARVAALATDNLAVLPAEWACEDFGMPVPPSVYDRCWLIMSLAELGREPCFESIQARADNRIEFPCPLLSYSARAARGGDNQRRRCGLSSNASSTRACLRSVRSSHSATTPSSGRMGGSTRPRNSRLRSSRTHALVAYCMPVYLP